MQDNMVETKIPTKSDHQPPKKKRNLPGMPDPEAEVIALSPKTLLATNRFVCEICSKGFQRDQNLQLHRRGHNLPWKLRQRSGEERRKRVYVCPEAGCVHHEASRALGDLTGIKKHFCRKHLEKKYKCERCSKKYAVQSDCRAHMKTCGTREYRCCCGTLFSRRDSFITHRAFCDALARENAQPPPVPSTPPPPVTPSATVMSPVLSIQSSATAENSNAELQPPPPPAPLTSPMTTAAASASASASSSDNIPSSSGGFFSSMLSSSSPPSYPSPLCTMAPPDPASLSLSSPSSFQSRSALLSLSSSSLFQSRQLHYVPRPQPAALSATALLQKAAQTGVTSSDSSSFLRGLGSLPTSPPAVKLESTSLELPSSSSLNGLTVFGDKPTTLDLLGLGVADGEAASGGFSAFLGRFGGAAGDAWDDSSENERKYNQSRFCKHD